MTKPTRESGNTIESLLQDRAQFVSWLTRLNSTGDGNTAVPESVRGRVRADYERRLAAVLEELRGHTSALEEQVEGLSARAQELSVREREHREQLAEAEVRHVVGEYDEVKWDGIRAELLKLITHVHEELGHTSAEVERLNEVLDTIRAPLMPEPAVPPPPVNVSAPRPSVATPIMPELITPLAPPPEPVYPVAATPPSGTPEIPFRPTNPRPAPRPPAAAPPKKEEQQPGRTLWFPSGKPEPGAATGSGAKLDELAFLKSVTGNEPPHAPAPATPTPRPRPSGGFPKTEVPAHPPAPPPAPPPALPEPPIAKAPPPPSIDAGKDRPSAGQKTLKCGECGTLNRPTEWYCERCGAELAAL
jgi:hypothetical protein